MSNCDNNNQQTTQSIADYLAQLLKDRKQLAAFPNVFNHIERLLDEGKNIFSYIMFSWLLKKTHGVYIIRVWMILLFSHFLQILYP